MNDFNIRTGTYVQKGINPAVQHERTVELDLNGYKVEICKHRATRAMLSDTQYIIPFDWMKWAMETYNWEIDQMARPYTITSDGWVVPARKQKVVQIDEDIIAASVKATMAAIGLVESTLGPSARESRHCWQVVLSPLCLTPMHVTE